MSDFKTTETKRVINDAGEIIYVPIQNSESQINPKKDINDDTKLSGVNKAEVYSQALTEGAKVVNKILDIVKIREQTDASLKTMDKQIELVERTTESEIKKMLAETDSWEKRFSMVSKLLQDMTITVTTNKDLHPDVAKALVNAVKEAMINMSKRE
jgi:aspartate/tyrosine/aromatic aminotransferase